VATFASYAAAVTRSPARLRGTLGAGSSHHRRRRKYRTSCSAAHPGGGGTPGVTNVFTSSIGLSYSRQVRSVNSSSSFRSVSLSGGIIARAVSSASSIQSGCPSGGRSRMSHASTSLTMCTYLFFGGLDPSASPSAIFFSHAGLWS
jgi:hypothetical protein